MKVDAKISITTACGAKCATCPSWKQPQHTMSVDEFEEIYIKLSNSPIVGRILINGTGDITAIGGWEQYLKAVLPYKKKFTTMTTNAAGLDHVPEVLDELIISFNGGKPDTYNKTTGLDFETVAENIRALYPDYHKLDNLEMHCLIWKGNEGDEQEFLNYWRDFPGALRLSFKTENQGREYFGVDRARDNHRIPCDYLGKICVEHDGRVAACNHDWGNKSNFGNLFNMSVAEVWRHPDRMRMTQEHFQGEFSGICEKCNYNVPADGKIVYG